MEKAPREDFLPDLFHGVYENMLERSVTKLNAKNTCIYIPEPNQTAQGTWTASCVITGHLVAVLLGRAVFRSGDHVNLLRDGHVDICWWMTHNAGKTMTEVIKALPPSGSANGQIVRPHWYLLLWQALPPLRHANTI